MLSDAGIPVRDVDFVTVGGGVGSFVTVDYLRICGVPPERIRVLTQLDYPWQTYEYLTRVSQIPSGERLRSDSASRPDCIWGFPSYAFSEAFRAREPSRVHRPPLSGADRAHLHRLLHAQSWARLHHAAAGVGPDRLRPARRPGPGPHGAPTQRRRLLHHPHATGGNLEDQAGGLPQPVRAHSRWLSGLEVPSRPPGVPAGAQ